MSEADRVVVTGCGAISPIGKTAPAFWTGLVEGNSGIAEATLVPVDRLFQKVVAEVKDYDPRAYFGDRQILPLDRVSQFAIVAAKEAIAEAGISFDGGLSERTATIVGTGIGGQTTLDEGYKRLYAENATRMYPLTIPKVMPNAPASQVSMHCGLRGPAFGIVSACSSATHAIGLAFQMVRAGIAKCAVAGGTEACITLGTLKGWEGLRVTAPDTCRPFSINRKGLVLGEGAAMVVLERLEDARQRGANILGEVAGFGMTADAADLTNPDEGGMRRAIDGALADARLSLDDIQYVNAHGTGTAANDLTETAAIKRSFGDHARRLAVSSIKSMIGHALGAAGALEFVATLFSVREGIAPPTMNYLGPDPACDLDYVPNEARRMAISAAISNSFAFGGLNAVLAVKRFS